MLVMNYLKKERDKFFYRLVCSRLSGLSKEALILYKCTNFYSPKDERGILWNDPFLNIDWPNNNPVVNEKTSNILCSMIFLKMEIFLNSKCKICNSKLVEINDFGEMPLANNFITESNFKMNILLS